MRGVVFACELHLSLHTEMDDMGYHALDAAYDLLYTLLLLFTFGWFLHYLVSLWISYLRGFLSVLFASSSFTLAVFHCATKQNYKERSLLDFLNF